MQFKHGDLAAGFRPAFAAAAMGFLFVGGCDDGGSPPADAGNVDARDAEVPDGGEADSDAPTDAGVDADGGGDADAGVDADGGGEAGAGTSLALGITAYDPYDPGSREAACDEIDALGFAAEFIHGPTWSELCGETTFDADYAGPAWELQWVLSNGTPLLYAFDFTESWDRSAIARPGTCAVAEGDFHFTNSVVSDAYMDELLYVADAFDPAYFAIGVEVDGFMAPASVAERSAYVATFESVYAALKAAHPGMVVFVYFQFEATAGYYPVGGGRWDAIADLADASDLFAFSSYPQATSGVGRIQSSADLSAAYFSPIGDHLPAGKRVAFAELGATLASTAIYDPGADPAADQALFVANFFAAVESYDVALVTWMFYYDLDMTSVDDSEGSRFFSAMGLRASATGPASGLTVRPAYDAFLAR